METLTKTKESATINKPIIIAGPCSAESRNQVIETALALKDKNIDVFRAGVWKPRTRPGNFEGVGSKALVWLNEAKAITGLPVATEVANVKHVYECLKHGVDILWIGARTTANPFAVQEIADSLRGVNIQVLVKNPVNPDVDLWIGAIERLNEAGINKVSAILRGFSTYVKSQFRNNPQWQIAVELKQRLPEIPLLCDPSHITGNKALIHEVSQKALDMNFNGLMIETHSNPNEALSDKDQQLTPSELEHLLKNLVVRKKDVDNRQVLTDLKELRFHIDRLDEELIDILEQRMLFSEIIGGYKKDSGITILQEDRWNEILKTRISRGEKRGLNGMFLKKMLTLIHQESINKQSQIM